MKQNKNKYIAIFSCFVLAAVCAVGISVTTAEKEKNNSIAEFEKEHLAEVNLSKNAQAKPKNIPAKSEEDIAKKEQQQETVKQENSAEATTKEQNNETEKTDKNESTAKLDEDEFEEAGLFDDVLVFSEPVSGEIALDYSVDKMVYDPTLEQYRTSDSICYKAEEGTAVSAAAQGTVECITNDNREGTSITVFHGDGWRTTYSQLSENVAVSQGDIVEKGQTLGYVGKPGIYSSAMGDHLEFKMTLDDKSVDPKTALAE